jgi:hypothetical protein
MSRACTHYACSHCGRSDKPLTTLTELLVGRREGRTRHLCPSCLAAVAEVAWIVSDRAAPRPLEQPPAWTVIA